MRLVQVTVPAGKRETVLSILDEKGIDYVVTDETSGREYTAVVYFPLPANAVEEVLDGLQSGGLNDDAYTVVIDAETVISRRFDELKERYEEEEESEDRVARQELRARAEDLSPTWAVYVVLTVVSAVLATAGVLLDSPAVVVGSMVIAPLIGPSMTASVGTVIDDRELFVGGLQKQAAGAALAVLSAAVFAYGVKSLYLVPPGLDIMSLDQLRGRVAPDFLSLAVALGAGVAGAVSLSAPISASLVGVAIAIALVPPTAVIGIGIAWGRPLVAGGALVLVLVNLLSINFAALAVLWYQGYRPDRWFRLELSRTATLRRLAILAAGLAVLSLFLGGVTYYSVQSATFEQQATDQIQDVLDRGEYEGVRLLEVQVRYREQVPVQVPETVVVTVSGDRAENPQLAAAIDDAIREATGRDVTVQVRFVDVQTA